MPLVKLPLSPAAAAGAAPRPLTARQLIRSFTTTRDGDVLSLVELARRAGLPRHTVKRVMLGRTSRPEFRTIARILAVLGKSNGWMLGYLDAIRPYRGKVRRNKYGHRREDVWQDVI